MTHTTWTIRKACFGATVAFDAESDVCKSCIDGADCATERAKRLPRLLEVLDKRHDARGRSLKSYYTKEPRKAGAKTIVEPHPGISNEQAQRLYMTLVERGVDMTLMKSGVNPLQDKRAPRYFQVAVETLLVGAVKRLQLVDILALGLDLNKVTANNYVNTTISLLSGLGILTDDNYILEIAK